jgi:hypothetical protein
MTAKTGRTVGRFDKFQIADSGATVRDLNIKTIVGIGVDYTEVDLTAANDPVGGALPGMPVVKIKITCVWDSVVVQAASATTAAPAFSGSHTVLSALAGLMTPLTAAFYRGVRHYWEAGEPVFGLASSATSGFLVRNYVVSGEECSADLIVYPGSVLPSWGTAQL